MFERVLSAYRRIVKSVSSRRTATLDVIPLEQRLTPALTPEGFALPLAAPPIVQVGLFNAHGNEANVRTDLFGAGAAVATEHLDEHDCFVRVPAPREVSVIVQTPIQQDAAVESNRNPTSEVDSSVDPA